MSQPADADQKTIDRVHDAVGKVINRQMRASFESAGANNLECAMALAVLAAHHVLHDGGDENDFVAVAKAAWNKSASVHEACRPGS